MTAQSTIFHIFRYQLLPKDRYFQGDFFNGINSVDELLKRKNEFFAEALSNTTDYSSGKQNVVAKILHQEEDFILLRMAHNRSMHRETIDFRDEVIDNWPSILIGIWNNPSKQLILVQKRTTAFSSSENVVNLINKTLNNLLLRNNLRAHFEPLFEQRAFWSFIDEYERKIKSVEFEFITPNMANISDTLPEDLKNFAKSTNSAKNKLSLESDPDAPLHLKKNNKTLKNLVEYSGEGGGNISIKVEGIKKKYNTKTTVREISLTSLEMSGTAEEVANILKDLLK